MKKILFYPSILLMTAALSACIVIDSKSKEDSSHYSSASSTYTSETSSSQEQESAKRVKSKYTYMDYGKYNPYGSDVCPSLGSPKLLVIPVWFTDSGNYISSNKKQNVYEDISKAYIGSEEDTGWHSVSSYYRTESMGKCNLSATISEWYECGFASTTFYSDINNTIELVKYADAWYFNTHRNDSRKNYDLDGNGYIDGIMLIYAAPDYVSMKKSNASNLWAYCYWVSDYSRKSTANPGCNAFFWASYDFLYSSGARASSRSGSAYGLGDNSHCTIDARTYIHEMGHVFGLSDYYDYSEEQYCPAGGLTMEDFNVAGHDPFSVIALGWTDPIVPTDTITIDLEAFQNNRDVVLLSPSYSGSPFSEYILVELYTPTGLNEMDSRYSYSNQPKAPSSTGIRVWHIDARFGYYQYNSMTREWSLDLNYFGEEPNRGNNYACIQAFSNTYNEPDYGSLFGQFDSKYYNYNLNQLIRKSISENYYSKSAMTNADLFTAGNSFDLPTYNRQFVENNYLNNGNQLGWSFRINSISNSKANITFTKQ